MDNRMFRYLEKYVGTYRVVAEYDAQTLDFPRDENGKLDESYDELYIPCKKGIIKHTYTPEMLVWMVDSIGKGRNVRKELDEKYKGKVQYTYEETSEEVMIFFNEEYLKKIATIVKPKTSGASIKPYSDKNLPKPPYEIPSTDLSKLYKITEGMSRQDKMLFLKKCVNDFDKQIVKIKGKDFNITEDRKQARLKPKMYIHHLGLWDEFLKFVEKRVKKIKG